MNVTFTGEHRTTRISEAIVSVYEAAGVEPDFVTPRIVQLDQLISAHSLRRAEISGLTRQSAITHIASLSGQAIVIPNGPELPLAGFLYAWPYRNAVWGCLFVEQNDMVERRRFSAAHELGHYMLHFRPAIQAAREQSQRLTLVEGLTYPDGANAIEAALPVGAFGYTRGADTELATLLDNVVQMEEEANEFAAELLMPEAACRALVQRYGGRASPRRLATEFLVSFAAMRWRLERLGLLV